MVLLCAVICYFKDYLYGDLSRLVDNCDNLQARILNSSSTQVNTVQQSQTTHNQHIRPKIPPKICSNQLNIPGKIF